MQLALRAPKVQAAACTKELQADAGCTLRAARKLDKANSRFKVMDKF